MDAKLIKRMGRKLREFLGEFDDCFGRSGPREHLRTYVSGQLSDMPRKSIEPIALAAKVPPRTLQYFLSSMQWDQQRMRDRTQYMSARFPHTLIVARNVLNPKEVKYFLSNMAVGSQGSLRLAPSSGFTVLSAKDNVSRCRRENYISPKTQSKVPDVSLEKEASEASRTGHQNQSLEILCAV